MIKSDYHMHSSFSGDSDTPTEQMIRQAENLGLERICFTEHYDPLFPCYRDNEPDGLFDLDEEAYLKYANEYKNSLSQNSTTEVCFGIELGMYPKVYGLGKKIIRENNYDFVICSSHTANEIDPYYPIYWEGKTVIEGATLYFEEILKNVSSFKDFDVYGHLDYCMRYVKSEPSDRELSNYKEIFEAIFKILIDDGKGIEINSNGLRSPMKDFNPGKEILSLYKEMGGEIITFGSDAHSPENIVYAKKEAEELLKYIGFKYHVNFKNRKPIFINL